VSLLLFDIDGTLLLSGGAGVRAMTRTFQVVFGIPDAFANADVAGRTDTFLLSSALQRCGLPDTPDSHERFREAYVAILREEMQQPPQGRCGLMPGVEPLLDVLHKRDALHLALLTGNFERAAYAKLGHFGIDSFFEWGVFGEESADRNELARAARRRAVQRAIPASAVERVVVIGDTPHDVACARAIGARVIAVATGNYSEDQLRAAGADVTLPDLADTERVVHLTL
jgi:phosphoglycolate phosphatase-like HAD superfamily hydrolase